MDYQEFLESKDKRFSSVGFEPVEFTAPLFPFQQAIVCWALQKGRSCIFADCGLGKSAMQLEWGFQVATHTRRPVLIVAPLAVSAQTVREGAKFGVPVTQSRDGAVHFPLTITNYEMLDKFKASDFSGVVLDESSIIKHHDGKTRTEILEKFAATDYRLACTATPSPNDYTELGNHSEFVGAMSRVEMLAKYFYHDGGDTAIWTLKGHAEDEFWKWVCSWAVTIRKPSDIGHDDAGYDLPPIEVFQHVIETQSSDIFQLAKTAKTLNDQRAVRRDTLEERCQKVAEMCNASVEQWVVWCDLNTEGDKLASLINGAVQVSGTDSMEEKEQRLAAFQAGTIRVLVSKVKIAGFGLNWQHCHNVAFVGPTHSYEMYYQAIRRNWRFGQKSKVSVHVVSSDMDGAVVGNLQRKEKAATAMQDAMLKHMALYQEITKLEKVYDVYKVCTTKGNAWEMLQGDCCERVKDLVDSSIDYIVYSPPFASLYTYSNSMRDMGNCDSTEEFFTHFKFLVADMLRVLKPGRLMSFHCMNLPTSKERDGFIGIRDFRGELVRAMVDLGWIFHSEVTIWKDPVTAMQRTKALGLLHKQLVKDSCMSRQGIPDYLVTMRKPGVNENPVAGPLTDYVGCDTTLDSTVDRLARDEMRESINIWQRYASPVWMDINPSRTLQKESAREDKDERHICPLQLDVIDRCLQLWTNPGDLVLSPFAGIGSEGYEAVKMGRRFVGIELKDSYYKQACANLEEAERILNLPSLFDSFL